MFLAHSLPLRRLVLDTHRIPSDLTIPEVIWQLRMLKLLMPSPDAVPLERLQDCAVSGSGRPGAPQL